MAREYTKQLIHDAFIKMLNERSLKNVTVKDIAVACDINRNAFYYYYSDIYELLSEIFETELQKVIDEYNDTLSWEESFILASHFALENKTAIYHVYDSMHKDEVVRYVHNVSGNVMSRYVDQCDKEGKAQDSDKQLIVAFYQCALSGMVIQWIETGMKEEPEDVVDRIGFLFDGSIINSLERSAESK